MSDKDRIDFLETVGDWRFSKSEDGSVVIRIFTKQDETATLRDAIDSFVKKVSQ